MFLFVTQAFWVFIVRICFFGMQSGLFEINEWEPACNCWTQISWQVMQRHNETADSDIPRIVLFCMKKKLSKSVAVLPQFW